MLGPITPAAASADAPPLSPASASKRFHYFAYGSNLLPAMLLLKEVRVHSVRRGFLEGVQLLFDLKYDSLVEPCYANLQRRAGARTHGVVYTLDARDMQTMDQAEGNGRSYVREEFEVSLYHVGESPIHVDASAHEKVLASAYICHPNNLSKVVLCDHPPSERYKNVILKGARHHQLDPAYIQWLENHPHTPLPMLKFTSDQLEAIEQRTFTAADLKAGVWRDEYDAQPQKDWAHPLLLSLKGIVFDIRRGKFSNSWKKNNAGKDMTLFCAGRVAIDAHAIPTCVEEFQPEHQTYINATLVDYAQQYAILGHMDDRDKYKF